MRLSSWAGSGGDLSPATIDDAATGYAARMSEEDEIARLTQQEHEAELEPTPSPGPGHPADETLAEESEPGQPEDTPTISREGE
jgi:hypothetical protein